MALDTRSTGLLVGTLAEQPAANSWPWILYFATDDQGGALYRSNGSAWVRLTPGVAAAGGGGSTAWQDITGKPATFPPDQHAYSSHTGLPDLSALPTPGQKNALAGTQGTPGATNQYVTHQDARLSDARAPTAHQHPASDITGLPAGGGETHVKLTADLAAATATALTNTTGLSFAVTANTYYRFQAWVVFRSAATTTALRLGATCPAFNVFSASVSIPSAADGASAMWHGWLTSSGDSVVGQGVQATNTDYTALMFGVVQPSANGTFQLQHATEIAGSAVTVRRGSVLSYTTI